MSLRVSRPLGEGPVWRSGKVVLLPWVCRSGLQLPSTSGGLLGLASGFGFGFFFPLYPTDLLASEDLSGAYLLCHGA